MSSLQNTQEVAASLGKILKVGDVVALKGDLGMGKTTFARFLIQSLLGDAQEVPSPTFTLVQVYETRIGPVYHFDAYRLKTPEESLEIGYEDAFQTGISLIEWPEKLKEYMPPYALTLQFHEVGGVRQLSTHGSSAWKEKLLQGKYNESNAF